MKQIHVYLLCLSVVNSTLSMEQQRPKLFDAHYDKTIITAHHGVYPPAFSVNIEANQLGWEKLNDIANMTYNTPIYQSRSLRCATPQQNLQQEEKKTLL